VKQELRKVLDLCGCCTHAVPCKIR
jgi:hypothetical protein